MFGYPAVKLTSYWHCCGFALILLVEGVQELALSGGQPGASGGGIFDTDGKLIGVHQMVWLSP